LIHIKFAESLELRQNTENKPAMLACT